MSDFFLGVAENPLRSSPYVATDEEGSGIVPPPQEGFWIDNNDNFFIDNNGNRIVFAPGEGTWVDSDEDTFIDDSGDEFIFVL